MNVKWTVAQALAINNSTPVNINDVVIDNQYVGSDGICVINFYHNTQQMSFTTYDWKEMYIHYGFEY